MADPAILIPDECAMVKCTVLSCGVDQLPYYTSPNDNPFWRLMQPGIMYEATLVFQYMHC